MRLSGQGPGLGHARARVRQALSKCGQIFQPARSQNNGSGNDSKSGGERQRPTCVDVYRVPAALPEGALNVSPQFATNTHRQVLLLTSFSWRETEAQRSEAAAEWAPQDLTPVPPVCRAGALGTLPPRAQPRSARPRPAPLTCPRQGGYGSQREGPAEAAWQRRG